MIKGKLLAYKDIPYFLIALLLLLFVFRGIIFSPSIFFERDSTVLEIPARQLGVKLLQEGNFALWTDAYGNGQPFLANIKHAVLYPSTFLYLILPFFLAFKLHYLLHFCLAWLGIYLLARSYTLSREASFLGATVFIFSGVFLSSVEFYNHTAALCWMPWILLVLKSEIRKYSIKSITLALLWTLLILAGSPFVIVITILFCLLQIFFFRTAGKRKSMLLAFSLILALLLSAVQLLPSFELLQCGERDSSGEGIWSLEAIQTFNFIFPHFLGNDRQPRHDDYWGSHLFDKGLPLYYSLYIGIGIFFLAFFGLQKPIGKGPGLYVCSLILFLLMAFGAFTPLFFLLNKIPPFSAIRYPVKYLIGFTFSLAMLAAWGFDRLSVARPRKLLLRKIFLAGSVLTLLLFIIFRSPVLESFSHFFVFSQDQSIFVLGNSIIRGLLLMLIFSLGILLLGGSLQNKKAVLRVLLAIAVVDLVLVNQFINPVIPQKNFTAPAVVRELTPPLNIHRDENIAFNFKEEVGGSVGMHEYLRDTVYPYAGIGMNISYFFSKDFYDLYGSYDQRLLNFFTKTGLKNRAKMLAGSGCVYYIGHHALPDLPAKEKNIRGYPLFIQELTGGQQQFRLVYDVLTVRSFEERLELFLQDEFDPFTSALVEKDIPIEQNTVGIDQGIVERLAYSQGEGLYSINNVRPVLLVIPGNYAPGWRAWDNGEDCEILRVNLASKGVFLAPGRHEVKVKYLPRSFKLGLGTSAVSWILVLAVVIASIFYRRNRSS